jgi:hypothetical protein
MEAKFENPKNRPGRPCRHPPRGRRGWLVRHVSPGLAHIPHSCRDDSYYDNLAAIRAIMDFWWKERIWLENHGGSDEDITEARNEYMRAKDAYLNATGETGPGLPA